MQPFEEPEPIEASHLLRTSCAGCGGVTLAAPGWERRALCGPCRGGSVSVVGMPHTVPAGYPRGERALSPEEVRSVPVVETGEWFELGRAAAEVPAAVMDLMWWGVCRGWRVRARRGAGAGREGYAVRFSGGGGREALAVYRRPLPGAWSWGSVWLWGEDLLPFGHCGLAGLKEWIDRGGRVEPAWYVGVLTGLHMAGLKAEWQKVNGMKPAKKARENSG